MAQWIQRQRCVLSCFRCLGQTPEIVHQEIRVRVPMSVPLSLPSKRSASLTSSIPLQRAFVAAQDARGKVVHHYRLAETLLKLGDQASGADTLCGEWDRWDPFSITGVD